MKKKLFFYNWSKVIILIIIILLSFISYKKLTEKEENSIYKIYEEKLTKASLKYLDNKNITLENGYSYNIFLNDLESMSLIDKSNDLTGCFDAYVMVSKSNDLVTTKPYVLCHNYVSKGTLSYLSMINNQDMNGWENVNKLESKSDNLLINGLGEINNNVNFTKFTFSKDDNFDAYGGFTIIGNQDLETDELVSVDLNKTYYLDLYAKMILDPGVRHTLAYTSYDIDDKKIESKHVMYISNTLTKLSRELKPGDKYIYVNDLSKWIQSTDELIKENKHLASIIAWNYEDSKGYKYEPLTYSRNYYDNLWSINGLDYKNNRILLNKSWEGPKIALGTYLSQGNNKTIDKYFGCTNCQIPISWTNYNGKISGIDKTGMDLDNKFRFGTAKIGIKFLANRYLSRSQLALSNITIKSNQVPKYFVSTSSNNENYYYAAKYDIQSGFSKEDKIYIRFNAKVLSPKSTRILAQLDYDDKNQALVSLDNPKAEKWYNLSSVNTINFDSDNTTLGLYQIYPSREIASNKTMHFKDVILINLTKIFGKGNEPTKEWLDANL